MFSIMCTFSILISLILMKNTNNQSTTVDFDSPIFEQAKYADEGFVSFYANEELTGLMTDPVWGLISELEDEKIDSPDYIPSLEEICNLSFLAIYANNDYQKRYFRSYRLDLLERVKRHKQFKHKVIIVALCIYVGLVIWVLY